MNDHISRQAVEDLIMETDPWWSEGMTRAIWEWIKKLPTIDTVKHGKWIEYPIAEGMNKCSECGVLRFGESNYCPNCGAQMEERSEE